FQEFLDLLNLVYLRTMEITDATVPHILKLADRFQMECLVNQSEKHLTQSSEMDVVKKLLLAEQYRLRSLKDHCFNSEDLIEKLKGSPEYDLLSVDTKVRICDKIMKN
ncbi:hypothetical protein PMAYCL1PPCAC_14599, partial [Pristionchus mayeri]